MTKLIPKAENMDGRSFEQWRLDIHRAIAAIGTLAYRDESAEMIEMFNAHANYDPKCAAHLWLKALLAKAP